VRLIKQDKNKTSRLTFRCTAEEENMIKQKALLYCQKENGEPNISEWMVEAATKHIPSSEDLVEEKQKKKKGKKK